MNRPEFEKQALAQLDAVYRVALALTRRQEKAEDLVQEVYAKAFRPNAIMGFEDRSDGRKGAEQGASMRAWLFTITHNTFYSQIKRARKAPVAVGEFFDESTTERSPDQPPPAWDLESFDWEHVDERLKKAVDDLKPEYRQVLMMWGVEGLKYREIADRLEVPLGTIMSRLHRARKILADVLGGPDGPASDLGVRVSSRTGVEGTP